MHARAPSLGRRSSALVLAYLLALQAILTAWAVLAPAAAGAFGAQAALCSTHANGPAPSSDLPPAQCLCGPLCHAGAAPLLGAPSETASVAVSHSLTVAVAWHVPPTDKTRDIATSPQQARAPPLTV
jgi:hypothetical protein